MSHRFATVAAMRGTNSTSDIDAILQRLARPQLGLVSVAQAAAAGVDKRALDRRRRSGALEPVFAEVMRLASAPISAHQRVLAAGLAVPGSVIAASSAAVAHDMPIRSGVDEPIVSVGRSRSARTAGIITLRPSIELPSQRWHTANVATPASTLVLLPRFVDAGTVERCLDHCLAHRLVSVGQVRSLIDRLPPRSVVGRAVLLGLLDERSAGIGHRSGLEQRVRRWLDHAGLRGWSRNLKVPVAVGPPVEVDFAWPDSKVALEVSPFFTHGSRAKQERDAERRRLLTVEGWRTVEATDPDLIDQGAFGRCAAALRLLLAGTSGASGPSQRDSAHPTPGREAA